MRIKKIEVTNFKSFKHLVLSPDKFNVIVGPNASGKTNFLRIFSFLRDIVNTSLENAISMQGGVEYLQNIYDKSRIKQTCFNLEIEHSNSIVGFKKINNKKINIKPITTKCNFVMDYTDKVMPYRVVEDILEQQFEFYEINDKEEKFLCYGKLMLVQNDTTIKRHFMQFKKQDDFKITIEDVLPKAFVNPKIYNDEIAGSLFLENPYNMPYPRNVHETFRNLSIYDLDGLRDNVNNIISGRIRLEDNGENIAIVLKKILSNPEKSREIFNYIHHILPFIEDIQVERILDKRLEIKLSEKYNSKNYLPASFMSSGTITLIAVIIALFFEDDLIAIFEEPGSRVHPYLISKIINLMKEASTNTQIFLTTHNTEIVKYSGIENVYCITRDKEGFSSIMPASSREDISTFLQNEIGLEELFVQNLLSK